MYARCLLYELNSDVRLLFVYILSDMLHWYAGLCSVEL